MMLQHCPTDVTGFVILLAFDANGADGTAYDSQYPRHAFVFIENSTQSGISIFLVWPSGIESKLVDYWTLFKIEPQSHKRHTVSTKRTDFMASRFLPSDIFGKTYCCTYNDDNEMQPGHDERQSKRRLVEMNIWKKMHSFNRILDESVNRATNNSRIELNGWIMCLFETAKFEREKRLSHAY